MKAAAQKTKTTGAVKAFAIVCALVLLGGIASAPKAASAGQMGLSAGYYDLLGAHNDRVLLTFGKEVHFERYAIVKMLSQYFTVASEVKDGIRYNISKDGGTKTLVIQ